MEQIKQAGAIILGKTNTHEIALGVTGNNPHYGTARNPWDTARIPGGSSSGSAIAVATGMALGALGTDTGGSIRIPASLCGVVGFKPTYWARQPTRRIPAFLESRSCGTVDEVRQGCCPDDAGHFGV